MKDEQKWKKIRAEYIKDSKSTYKSIAEKYNISFHTLAKRATREKWNGARQQIGEKQAKKTAEKIAEGRADKLFELIDNALGLIKISVDNLEPSDTKGLRLLVSALKDISLMLDIKSELEDKNSNDLKCGVVFLPAVKS